MTDDRDGTTETIDGFSGLDMGIKAVTAMLNRCNKARLIIRTDDVPDGYEDIIMGRFSELVNHMPKVIVSSAGNAIIVDTEGYEIPYSWKGWFYTRRCHYDDTSKEDVWTDSITCGMRHH